MSAAGFRSVRSYNPDWDTHGKTFEDLDGVEHLRGTSS
jgi:YycE-like protein